MQLIVCGVGFAGLADAHELSSAGIDVTVLEARQRATMLGCRSKHIQRMQKALNMMNLKLTNMVASITSVMGMKIVRARRSDVTYYDRLFFSRTVSLRPPPGRAGRQRGQPYPRFPWLRRTRC